MNDVSEQTEIVSNSEKSEQIQDNLKKENKKNKSKDLGKILETLGYDVVYKKDGTLVAYW